MVWKPSTAQLETIAELTHARMGVARTAAAVGVTEAEFTAWVNRLVASREAPPVEVPFVIRPPREREARLTADRVFDRPEQAAAE